MLFMIDCSPVRDDTLGTLLDQMAEAVVRDKQGGPVDTDGPKYTPSFFC